MKKTILILLTLILFFNCKSKKQNSITKNQLIDSTIADSLSFELCQIYGLDQGIRNEFLWRKHIDFGNVHRAIDTLSFNKIIKFIKENGYPNRLLLGDENHRHERVNSAAMAVFLHNPHRIVNEKEHFDLLLNEVKKGNLTSEYLATILDKYYWTKSKNKINRRVLYGSQFGKPCIQTKEITNKARIEIGLKPLNDDEFVDCEGEEQHILNERK